MCYPHYSLSQGCLSDLPIGCCRRPSVLQSCLPFFPCWGYIWGHIRQNFNKFRQNLPPPLFKLLLCLICQNDQNEKNSKFSEKDNFCFKVAENFILNNFKTSKSVIPSSMSMKIGKTNNGKPTLWHISSIGEMTQEIIWNRF